MLHLGSLHCFRLAHCFDSSVAHFEGAVAEEDPKEELVAKSAGHGAPSLVSDCPSYLAEDVDLGAAASDVDLARVT